MAKLSDKETVNYSQPSQVNQFFLKPIVLGSICIVVAIITGLFFVPWLLSAQNDTMEIIVAKADISSGEKISEEMLQKSTILASGYSEGAYINAEEVINQYAKSFIYTGDAITINKVDNEPRYSGDIGDATQSGKLVFSVTLPNLSSSVSGKLKPGDLVSALTSEIKAVSIGAQSIQSAEEYDGTNTTDEVIYKIIPELKYIEVCNLTSQSGSEVSADISQETNTASLPVTITLFVSEEQALKLFSAQQQGNIAFAFVARGEERESFVEKNHLVIK